LGIFFAVLGLYCVYLGEQANYKEEYKLLKMETKIAYCLMYTGAGLMLTAGIGWSAAASKNEFVTYCSGYLSCIIMMVFLGIGVSLFMVQSYVRTEITNGCITQSGPLWEME